MTTLSQFSQMKLAMLEGQRLRRSTVITQRVDGIWVERGGRRLLSFSCNDYLNLTHHPDVKRAAVEAIEFHGSGAGASRLVTGNCPLVDRLEARLAAHKQTEAACVFGSGYLANAGTIPAIVGAEDVILVDELAHSCMWAGARLSRAKVLPFRHNDTSHAEDLLARDRRAHVNALILAETVYSMDGDRAPLDEFASLARSHDAWIMTDDAHGTGLAGHAASRGIDLQMGTLSKALASYGGYVCADRNVVNLIKTRARTLIYSTGLPPASAAAALAALDVIEADPDLVRRPLAKARLFTRACDLPLAQSPIVPVLIGDEQAALDAQEALEREGILAVAIRPPTVPEGTARLRLAFTANHPDAEIERLAALIRARVLPFARGAHQSA